jgi:hypothetical protein
MSRSRAESSLIQRLEETRDALLHALPREPPLAPPLGDDHLDDLAAPGDEIGEKLHKGAGSPVDHDRSIRCSSVPHEQEERQCDFRPSLSALFRDWF